MHASATVLQRLQYFTKRSFYINDLSGDGELKIFSDVTILRCAKLHEALKEI